jgi:ADP-ribose pyrophosphatase
MTNSNEILYTGRRFAVERLHYLGSDGCAHCREVVRHPGAVVVIPLLNSDRICLVRNYRPAVNATLIELPAGTREPNEHPEQTAARELAEETGYSAGKIERIHAFFPSPGILDEEMLLYVATDLRPGTPRPEPGEEIENLVVPGSEAVRMALDGSIRDAKTIVGILVWDRVIRLPNRS